MRLIISALALCALGACTGLPPPSPDQIDLAAQIAAEVAKHLTTGG